MVSPLSCASSILLVNNIDCGLCLSLQVDDSDDDWREKRRREEQAWTQIFSRLVVQWAQWFSKLLLLNGGCIFLCLIYDCILHTVLCDICQSNSFSVTLEYQFWVQQAHWNETIGLLQKCQFCFLNNSKNTPEYMLPSLSIKAGVGLVKCAANVVVGSGAWVGSTLSRVLLRRQPNGTEKVNTYLSPIQVSLFRISEYD